MLLHMTTRLSHLKEDGDRNITIISETGNKKKPLHVMTRARVE